MKLIRYQIINIAFPLGMTIILSYLFSKNFFIPDSYTIQTYRTAQIIQFSIQVFFAAWALIGLLWDMHHKSSNYQKTEKSIIIFTFFSSLLIILGLSFPRYPQMQERFRLAECANNLRKAWLYLSSYAENEGCFPCNYTPTCTCPSAIGSLSYIYHYQGNNKMRWTLLMDNPENHTARINILLSNGEIHTVRTIDGKIPSF